MADPVMDLVLYMSQINKDIEYLDSNPHSFKHAKRLLEEECDRIRHQLYNFDEFALEPLELPEGTGQKIVVRYKIYFPVEDSNFNFVGRLLGPKGETIKQMEKDTKCRIVLRGKGIKNNTRLTRQSRYSDFDEDRPHVLLSIKTFENIAFKLMDRAAAHVLKVINPTIGDDEFKRRQLIHNAILNGEYRGPRIRELTPGDVRAQNLLGNSMLSKGVFVSNIIEDQEEVYQDGRELENIYPVMSPKEQQRYNQLYYMNIQQQALAPDYQFYPSLPNKAREINDQCHSSLPFERQVKFYQSHPSLPIGALGLNHQTHPSLPIETLGLNYQSHSSLPTEALELNYQPHPSLPTEAQKYHSSIFKTHEPINRFHPSPPNEEQGPSNQFHHYSPFEKLIPNYEFNLPTSSDDEDPSPNTPYYHFHSSSPIESSEEESDCLNYPLFYTPSILYEAQESSQPISSLSAEAHPYYPYQLRNLPVPQASINYLYYN